MKVYVVVNGFAEEGWGLDSVHAQAVTARARARAMALAEQTSRQTDRDLGVYVDDQDLELVETERGWELGSISYLVFEFELQDGEPPPDLGDLR